MWYVWDFVWDFVILKENVKIEPKATHFPF